MREYDKQQSRLHESYETQLNELDKKRYAGIISDSEYWNKYKDISNDYNSKMNELDSVQRTKESLLLAKENKSSNRPETTYAEKVGVLKAKKLASLINDLSLISSDYKNVDIAIDDPFYMDKKDPIAVFERWWNEFMESFPSLYEINDFLNRISINEKGYILFDKDKDPIPKDISSEDMYKVITSLKDSVTKSAKEKRKEKELARINKIKRRSPLLSKNAKSIVTKKRKNRQQSKMQNTCDSFHAVVDAYSLPLELSDLLYKHIDVVCVPKGLYNVDEYQHMLEQFLRYVEDPNERMAVVNKSIRKGWRILSNGTI